MAGLVQRFRDLVGPSRRELQDQIANLEHNQRRFSKSKGLASGVEMGWGDFEYEQNTKLRGADKFDVFDKMEADPHVKGVLMDKALPLLTAEWEIKPASDKAKDEDIAEFCAANLLRTPSEKYGRDYWIQTSWKAQRLPEILNMLRDGFAMFVSSWRREGTKEVYDRLQWIEPGTIDGTEPWVLDDADNIIAINRKLETPQNRFLHDERIEADRLKLYIWDMKGARYEGRSFIRSMYGAWLRKEFMLRQAVIAVQKVGAPIPIGHYPENWDSGTITRFKQLVKAARGSSPAEAYAMLPKAADGTKADVEYLGSDVEVDRMRGPIDGENREIHHGGRDSGAMLGETESGSRSLGDSKGGKESKLAQSIGEIVAEWENHGVANLTGTIQELVDRNFSANAYPELVCTKVDPFANFDETVKAWEAGIIPKTADSRRQITEGTLGLNLPDEAYEIEPLPLLPPVDAPVPSGATAANPDANPPAEDSPRDEAVAAALESLQSFRSRIAPLLEPVEDAPKGARFRSRNHLEARYVNLAAVQESFRVGERDFLVVLRTTNRAMITELMGRLRAGKITTRSLESQRRSNFRGTKKSTSAVFSVGIETGETGFVHVKDELEAQA